MTTRYTDGQQPRLGDSVESIHTGEPGTVYQLEIIDHPERMAVVVHFADTGREYKLPDELRLMARDTRF